jgi:hypothetical protein
MLISKKKSKLNKRRKEKKKAKKLNKYKYQSKKTLVHVLPFQKNYNSGILLDVCSFINTML